MKISSLGQQDIPDVMELMGLGVPFIRPRTASDYWLYSKLFWSTCPIARRDGVLVGAVMAFRSQEAPAEIYVQDVVTHPEHRRTGVTSALLETVRQRGLQLGVQRLYLTSEPDNTTAHATWIGQGFVNMQGDQLVNGVHVISNYKGSGKHRAVYERIIQA